MNASKSIIDALERAGFSPDGLTVTPCGAGSFRVADSRGTRWFAKHRLGAPADFFAAEAQNLRKLGGIKSWRVPQVVAVSSDTLVMSWLDLVPRSRNADSALGTALAHLHGLEGPSYGWPTDNYIGLGRQHNGASATWAGFFYNYRLAPQWDRLTGGKARGLSANDIEVSCNALLEGHQPPPSLLHGDFWSGNAAATADGYPATFDGACYYGDAETDLAMSRMFGGFTDAFYDAYVTQRPMKPGWRQRQDLYQLYHWLNHANLFAGGYLSRALNLARKIRDRIG